MNIRLRHRIAALLGTGILTSSLVLAGPPTGAKALFDSGEGTTVGMSVGQEPAKKAAHATRTAAAPAKEKYVGISYQLMVLSDDGRMTAVSKNRTFRTGERVKIMARTNRPGYLAVLNRGSSGQTHVLYHEYVEPFAMLEIPRGTNLRFVGAPGKEDVVLMLSDQPNPIALQAGLPASGAGAAAPPAGSYSAGASTGYAQPSDGRTYSAGDSAPASASAAYPSAPGPSASSSYYGSATPAPAGGQSYGSTMMASIDGAKGLHGAKDLVMEDSMDSAYAVVSPRQGYQPVQGGMKDLVLESSGGTHYGVVPVAAVADGGMLTLKITLRHR